MVGSCSLRCDDTLPAWRGGVARRGGEEKRFAYLMHCIILYIVKILFIILYILDVIIYSLLMPYITHRLRFVHYMPV